MSPWFPHPLPWYVAGPLIGLIVPVLLLPGNRPFGVSSNLRHVCAAVAPCGIEYFKHDWKRVGFWNLVFLCGIFAGTERERRSASRRKRWAPACATWRAARRSGWAGR